MFIPTTDGFVINTEHIISIYIFTHDRDKIVKVHILPGAIYNLARYPIEINDKKILSEWTNYLNRRRETLPIVDSSELYKFDADRSVHQAKYGCDPCSEQELVEIRKSLIAKIQWHLESALV